MSSATADNASTIANEIHESLVETLFESNYTCTYVELFDADIIAVRIKL